MPNQFQKKVGYFDIMKIFVCAIDVIGRALCVNS